MATRKTAAPHSAGTMTLDQRGKMVATMIELAHRNSTAESLMVRVANAGGITEVLAHVKQMRSYLKTHTRNSPAPANKAWRKRKSKSTRTRGNRGASAGDATT